MARSNRTLINSGIYIGVLVFSMDLALCAHAEIYKWTDENGKVHYGDRPPADTETEDISEVENRVNTESDGDKFRSTYKRNRKPSSSGSRKQTKPQMIRDEEAARRKQAICQREKDHLAHLLISPPYTHIVDARDVREAQIERKKHRKSVNIQRKKTNEACE